MSRKKVVLIIIICVVFAAALSLVLIFGIPFLREKNSSGSSGQVNDQTVGYTTIDELSDKHIGVMRGSIYEEMIARNMPAATVTLYDKVADMTVALNAEEIDAFICSDVQAGTVVSEKPGLKLIVGFPEKSYIAFAFPKTEKGAALRDEFNEFLDKIKNNGTLGNLEKKWSEGKDRNVEIFASDGKKGSLKFVTTGTTTPYSFMYNGKLVGLDVDLAAQFCHEYGYDIDINVIEFGSIIPGLSSGDYNFAGANITVTDERAERVYFSESYSFNEVAFVVRTPSAITE